MRDPQQALREKYLSLLDGNIAIGGTAIPVFADFVPSDANRPYILLTQQTVADGRTGNCPSADCTILVDIVYQAGGNLARTSDLNAMASQVMDALSALNTRPTNEIEGFEVTRHYLESSNMLDEGNGAYVVIRRLLRFRDLVFERESVTTL